MVKGVISIPDMTYGWHRLPVYLGLAEVAQNSHRYLKRDDRQISIRDPVQPQTTLHRNDTYHRQVNCCW